MDMIYSQSRFDTEDDKCVLLCHGPMDTCVCVYVHSVLFVEDWP